MDLVELKLQTANTAAFIDANPAVITLIPTDQNRTPAGGWIRQDLPPRPPQKFRLVEVTGTANAWFRTLDGEERKADWVIIGLPDLAIARGDHWTDNGHRYTVEDVTASNGYETRALVTERGV